MNELTDYTFVEQPTPVLSVYEKAPYRVERKAPGHYLIDFGEEITGHYKGFRYVEVIGPEQTIRPLTFGAIVRHYPLMEDHCVFTSSDDLLNKIFNICRNGIKYGAQEQFVDCPTREKGQYLGDNTVIGHAHNVTKRRFAFV